MSRRVRQCSPASPILITREIERKNNETTKVTACLTFFSVGNLSVGLALSPATAEAQTSRTSTANSYLDRGNSWFLKGELERAIADFDLAIGTDPHLAAGYYNRAIARFRLEDFDGSLADFNRAIQLNPRGVEAYVGRSALRI